MERNSKLDWLRAIGTFLVIFAHSKPPVLLKHIRCFDVCLLFFVSGVSFALTNRYFINDLRGIRPYLIKRIKKLAIPAWALVTFIFISTLLICLVVKADLMYSVKDYILSMLFTNQGVGYVWIVKLYLFTAIALPFVSVRFNNYTVLKQKLLMVIYAAIYCIMYYVYVTFIKEGINAGIQIVIEEFILCSLAYAFVAILGMVIYKNKTSVPKALVVFTLCFVLLQIFGLKDGFCPNETKWPPSPYYLTYGISLSLLLYILVPNKRNVIIEWISKHSYDIYLLHIPFIVALMICRSSRLNFLPDLLNNCYFCYAVLLVGGMGSSFILDSLRKKLIMKE